MKNISIKLTVLFLLMMLCFGITSSNALAAKKKAAKGMSADEITAVTTILDNSMKKVYASSLFSPEENEKLIEVKIKLDNAVLLSPTPDLAPLLYKAGILYKTREYKDHAIDCFQTILENFGDTALAPKAKRELEKMGIKVQAEEEEPAE